MSNPLGQADKVTLVSGGTGRQGGALVKYLLNGPWSVRVFTKSFMQTDRLAQIRKATHE